jgi:hypothetical protein
MSEFVFAGTYWIVLFGGGLDGVFVDKGTYKMLSQALDSSMSKTLVIDDVYGVEHVIVLSKVSCILESSPESRLAYRRHNQAIEEEKTELGPYNPGGDVD